MVTGSDLRSARERHGITLGQLAQRIGRTKGHLSKVERGVEGRTVTPALIRDYERALGIQIPTSTGGATQPGGLADMARIGGIIAGHLSRAESGEREVTPTTVAPYQRMISTATGDVASPTVDDVRRRSLFAVAALPMAGLPRQVDVDECAQWLAWEMWRAGDAFPAVDVPSDRAATVSMLVERRYVVCGTDGGLRFPMPGMLDFYLAQGVFEGIAAGSPAQLEAAQTSHGTDLVLAQFTADDSASTATLARWMVNGASAVLRVNAAGVLAKVGTTHATDAVVRTLRIDGPMRALYLTAVASRVLGLSWAEGWALSTGAATAGDAAAESLARELRNPRDAAARWCAAVLIYQAGAASRANVRAAVAEALRAEPATENLRTIAALAAGVDPVSV